MTHTPRKNNEAGKSLTLREIAEHVGGRLAGDPGTQITGVAGIEEAKKGDITLFDDKRYLPFLQTTQASAVVVSEDSYSGPVPQIIVPAPSRAFVKIIEFFRPPVFTGLKQTHPTALVGPGALLGRDVTLGPYAVIEEGAVIGEGSVIGAHVFIGRMTRIGKNVTIYPNVTVREETSIGDRTIIHSGAVIGSDGFGYETVRGEYFKLPQIGSVVIDEDVEIGANVTVDRGRFSKTWIQKGTKIDNLVQIAHNVVIGPHCLVVSQAGISGSTKLGRHVVVAGQAGIVGHIEIGDESVIGAGAGVTKSVPPRSVMLGQPAKPVSEQKRLFALISRLPDLFKEVMEIKKGLPERQDRAPGKT